MNLSIIGQKYNSLTISEIIGKDKVYALCVCGTLKEYYFSNIKGNKTKSCGCLAKQLASEKHHNEALKLIWNKFGKLTITEIIPITNDTMRKCIAVCECGDSREYFLGNITSGKTKSCGCENRKSASSRFKNYNKTRVSKFTPDLNESHQLSMHPLYTVWSGMLNRCYNPNDISFCNYGAKGVIICEEWRTNFLSFYNWAINNGWEQGLQIDKDINGDGKLYSPNTCVFVTRKVNCRNRTTNRFIEYNGETKTLAEWCEITGLKHTCIIQRISSGWNLKRTFETPAKNNGYVKS